MIDAEISKVRSSKSARVISPDPIQRAVEALHPSGGVVELRALSVSRRYGRPGTVSGYYDDYSELARDAAEMTRQAKGVYITLQRINPALLARSANQCRLINTGEPTTSDTDAEALQWLYIDVDAARPSGIMATEEEREEAFGVARQVRAYLEGRGWPEPVRVDSGNGAHLLYPIDLDVADAPLLKGVLEALAFRFNTPGAGVDCSVFNPARIIRLGGTLNRKGDSTTDRPHRWARLVDVPGSREIVPREDLEAVRALRPEDPGPRSSKRRRTDLDIIDAEHYLAQAGVGVVASGPWNGGTRYILEECPWNGHTDRSAYVVQFANGALAAGCHHNSCQGMKWHDFRDAVEGTGWRDRQADSKVHVGSREKPVAAREIGVLVSEVERERFRWLWKGRLALGKLTILDGDPGTGKSTLYCEIAARLTTGRGWPDENGGLSGSEHAGNVVIVTCEDGIADTIRPRLEEAGADLARCLVVQTVPAYDPEREEWIDAVPTIPDHLREIEGAVKRMQARLLIVDPLFAHLSGDVNSYRDQDVRRALTPLAQLAERLDVAVLVVRHLNKMTGGNVLYRGGGSIGIVGIVRLGLLLGRVPDDEEALVLASTKSNISRMPSSLALRIVSSPNDPEVGMVQWEGTSSLTAQDLVSRPAGQGAGAVDTASDWLQERLASGPQLASDMYDGAEAAGISQASLKRAKKKLDVNVERSGGFAGDGRWYWSLVEPDATKERTKATKMLNPEDEHLSHLSTGGGFEDAGMHSGFELF